MTYKLDGVRAGRSVDECWLWPGCLDERGRPCSSGNRPRPMQGFYEALIGPVPEGMVLKRTCADNACVNPYHATPMVWDRGIVRAKLERRRPRDPKIPILAKGTAKIPLGLGRFAIIDALDLPLVGAFRWHVKAHHANAYAVRQATDFERRMGLSRSIMMHRVIAPPPDGMMTDHIDRDGLNNRRSNLRYATAAQNQQNKVAYRKNKLGLKGVQQVTNGFKATIGANGEKHDLGVFPTPEQAADAYDAAARELHGEFGRSSRGFRFPK